MPAPVINFSSALAARRDAAEIAIALFDAVTERGEATCVAVLLCSDATAGALVAQLVPLLQSSDNSEG